MPKARPPRVAPSMLALFACVQAACAEPPAPAPPTAPAEPANAAAPPSVPAAPEPAPTPTPAAQPADPNEACGRILVVAYAGVAHAPGTVTRKKPEAEARARELLDKIKAGTPLGTLAATESDAPSSAARDGLMGTHKKPDWPPLHAALRDPLFALEVGAVAPAPIEADYGYVLLQRCPVEKARSRHLLVRYQGAKNADKTVTRSKADAQARATELLAKLQAGADFAALARAESEDSSKERGGDVGLLGRGLLAPAYDRALFSLALGKPTLIETDFGFHIIERLPDGAP